MVTIRAIYEQGQIRILDDIELEEGQELKIHIVKKEEISNKRILGLHRGLMEMSDDFDDPLPDSFWLGEDE